MMKLNQNVWLSLIVSLISIGFLEASNNKRKAPEESGSSSTEPAGKRAKVEDTSITLDTEDKLVEYLQNHAYDAESMVKNKNITISTQAIKDVLRRNSRSSQALAYAIAKDMYTNGIRNLKQFVINTVFKDHSMAKEHAVRAGDSYFITDDKDNLDQILLKVISSPNNFKYYERGRCELEINKTFDLNEVKDYLKPGATSVGRYNTQKEEKTNKVLVCFSVEGMKKALGKDFINGGTINTAYPGR